MRINLLMSIFEVKFAVAFQSCSLIYIRCHTSLFV